MLDSQSWKTPGSDQTPAELIDAGGEILQSKIHKFINSIWNVGYKPEGRRFESWWGEILHLPNESGRTRPWGSLSLYQKWVPETLKENNVSGE
jgi:hypothetical protein